jgi:hypothetical protein
VSLRRREPFPVHNVGREVDFFSGPKGGFGFFAHPPDIIVLDGEEDKTMGVCLEEQLGGEIAFSFGILVTQDLSAHRWRFFYSFPGGRGVSGVVAELIPVVAVLADEVRDLAEGLVGDDVLEGHGDGGN